jgi:ATP adenylyltransferase
VERIWAPWRMTYLNNSVAANGCIFCAAWQLVDQDRERLVLVRSEHSLIMLNRYPYTGAHLIVASARHTAELDDLADEELLDLMQCVRRARGLLRTAVKPDGFNIGINLGKAAGAGFDDHLHIHVVGRWIGDTNFMPVCGDVHVISEGLMEIYDRLRESLGEGK